MQLSFDEFDDFDEEEIEEEAEGENVEEAQDDGKTVATKLDPTSLTKIEVKVDGKLDKEKTQQVQKYAIALLWVKAKLYKAIQELETKKKKPLSSAEIKKKTLKMRNVSVINGLFEKDKPLGNETKIHIIFTFLEGDNFNAVVSYFEKGISAGSGEEFWQNKKSSPISLPNIKDNPEYWNLLLPQFFDTFPTNEIKEMAGYFYAQLAFLALIWATPQPENGDAEAPKQGKVYLSQIHNYKAKEQKANPDYKYQVSYKEEGTSEKPPESLEVTAVADETLKQQVAEHVIKYMAPKGGSGKDGTGEVTVAGVYFGEGNVMRFYRIGNDLQKYIQYKRAYWVGQYSKNQKRPWIKIAET